MIVYLFDDEVVLSEFDEQMFPDAMGRGQDPTGSDEGSAAENFSIFVQDRNLPRPTTFGGFSAS